MDWRVLLLTARIAIVTGRRSMLLTPLFYCSAILSIGIFTLFFYFTRSAWWTHSTASLGCCYYVSAQAFHTDWRYFLFPACARLSTGRLGMILFLLNSCILASALWTSHISVSWACGFCHHDDVLLGPKHMLALLPPVQTGEDFLPPCWSTLATLLQGCAFLSHAAGAFICAGRRGMILLRFFLQSSIHSTVPVLLSASVIFYMVAASTGFGDNTCLLDSVPDRAPPG